MSRRMRAALLAATLALVVPLAGCSFDFTFSTGGATSTPTGEKVAAELEPLYGQVLQWQPCGDGAQCATAKAPLDWTKPAADRIDLALVRRPATGGKPMGSLLVNPGGPGASGYDLIHDSVTGAVTEPLMESFDIVGFDPRGVNRSTPVSCYDDPAEMDAFVYDIPEGKRGSDAWIAASMAAAERFGAGCLEHTGPLLGHVDTVSAARDLDLLRALLGDDKLNYLGYSYGTFLGATYADLYPERTGRLVLDGALDPTVSSFEISATQAAGFESALRAFFAECPKLGKCPFSGSVDESMATVRSLLDRLEASPLRNADGRELGSSSMLTAIILPLYSEDSWPALVDLFTTVFAGDPSFAFTLADSYNSRSEDGSYLTNLIEAFTAINCLDYVGDASVETMSREAAELDQQAPVFGHLLSWGGIGCAKWPFPPTGTSEPIVAPGSADILVLGTTNDPATPYAWSKSLAEQLENGHLVTRNGEGHTAFNKGNNCINETVEKFFLDGTVPSEDPKC